MKIELHDLKQQKWFIEIEPSQKIHDLKQRNTEERGLDPESTQKLIYSGKILKDTDLISSLNYNEGKGYIVCIVSKKSIKKSTGIGASIPKTEPVTPAAPAKEQTPATSAPKEAPTTKTSGPITESMSPPGVQSGPSAFATGQALASAVSSIRDMGYSKRMALAAMRKAFNNPDRAVEYLVTGQIESDDDMDEDEDEEDGASASADDTNTDAPRTTTTTSHNPEENNLTSQPNENVEERDLFSEASSANNNNQEIDFQSLLGLSDDYIQTMRESIRDDPYLLDTALDVIMKERPDLATFLAEHVDEFLKFVVGLSPETPLESADSAGNDESVIKITAKDQEAIHRLTELGFDEQEALVAYIACDEDEQLAANYLFENKFDDE